MNILPIKKFNLEWTLLGGQDFSWDYINGSYYNFSQDKVIKLTERNGKLYWQTYPESDNEEYVNKYFRTNLDYKTILQAIGKDKHVKKAINLYPDLRLLSQNFEQTLLSFILSANNNIKSIRKSIRTLNEMYGKSVKVDGLLIRLFPKTKDLAEASPDDLLKTKIGFRAKYLSAAAQRLINTNLIKKLDSLSESQLRKELLGFYGVGEKITDCVLCYALEFDNVTPIDVWGKRIATQLYGLDDKRKYDEYRDWFSSYFNGYAAWAGQFLFEYIRNLKLPKNY